MIVPFIEFISIIFAFFGLSVLGFYQHIDNLKRNALLKYVYKLIGTIILPLFLVISIKSFAKEYFEIDMDIRLCRVTGTCRSVAVVKPSPVPNGQNIQSTNISKKSDGEVCKLALNQTKDNWSESHNWQRFVLEAKRRNKVIDTCRFSLGLRSISAQIRYNEELRAKSLNKHGLCAEALGFTKTDWDISLHKNEVVREAKRRSYKINDCRISIGLDSVETADVPSELELSGEDEPIPPKFPTGKILNSLSDTNLRNRPGSGNSSSVIGRLKNGTELVLLGRKPSPTSGHYYCRVLTDDGVSGYVDHQLISGSCQLNFEQSNYLTEIDSRERNESIRLLGVLAKLILSQIGARN